MKSYTDLEQSKKLAEFLSLESADIGWNVFVDGTTRTLPINDWDLVKDGSGNVKFYPAWSLSALLRLIPNFNMFKRTIECKIETTNHLIDKACDPIDAAYEMVCWLKENNKI